MNTTMLSILIGLILAQVAVVIIYHQRAIEKLRQLKYNYGLEALKLEKRIQALQKSILDYHDRIDEVTVKIDEYKG